MTQAELEYKFAELNKKRAEEIEPLSTQKDDIRSGVAFYDAEINKLHVKKAELNLKRQEMLMQAGPHDDEIHSERQRISIEVMKLSLEVRKFQVERDERAIALAEIQKEIDDISRKYHKLKHELHLEFQSQLGGGVKSEEEEPIEDDSLANIEE